MIMGEIKMKSNSGEVEFYKNKLQEAMQLIDKLYDALVDSERRLKEVDRISKEMRNDVIGIQENLSKMKG